MTGFNILMTNDNAFRFVGMMCANSGLVEQLPEKARKNIREIFKAVVVFNNNSISCMFEVENDFYEAIWNGEQQAFQKNIFPYCEIDDSDTIGLILPEELDKLFYLFTKGEPIFFQSGRIERIKNSITPSYNIVCTNGTIESIFAKNTFYATGNINFK